MLSANSSISVKHPHDRAMSISSLVVETKLLFYKEELSVNM